MYRRHAASAEGVRKRGASRCDIWAGLLPTRTLPRSEFSAPISNSSSQSRLSAASGGDVPADSARAPRCKALPGGGELLAGARREEVEEDESVTSVVVVLVQCKVGTKGEAGAVGDDRRML